MKFEIKEKSLEILDVYGDNNQFRINVDVLNQCFGANRSLFCKACYPDKTGVSLNDLNKKDNFIVWMPKLYGNSSNWKNILSEDGTMIYEVGENGRTEDWKDKSDCGIQELRLVFVKPSKEAPYKFAGVFETHKMDFLNHSYKRIATKARLIGNPVTTIELLDDIR